MARPRRTPSSTTVYRLPGGTEYNDLWVSEYEEADGSHIVASTWELSDEERAAIADGANIYLEVWGHGHPPVAISITSEELGKGGADDQGPETDA